MGKITRYFIGNANNPDIDSLSGDALWKNKFECSEWKNYLIKNGLADNEELAVYEVELKLIISDA